MNYIAKSLNNYCLHVHQNYTEPNPIIITRLFTVRSILLVNENFVFLLFQLNDGYVILHRKTARVRLRFKIF